MRKHKAIFLLIIAALALTFIFCQKKLFGSVEVHGQILNYFTYEPISVDVTLVADNVHSASSYAPESITLAETTSKSDGTFSLKSKPSKGSNYYLHIDNMHFYDAKTEQSKIELSKNSKKDMGVILSGSQEFICKVTLVSTSGSKCIWFYDRPNNKYTFFNTGTNTTIIYKQKYDVRTYESNQHKFLVECRIDYYNPSNTYILSNTSFWIPINSTDTLTQIINY